MSYHLKTGEHPAAGIRRIVREQLERALRDTAALGGVEERKAVHAIRKRIKKIRALLRLVQKEIGNEVYREEKDRLRIIAHSFSGLRDAQVQLQVLEKLHESIVGDVAGFTAVTHCLERQLAAATNEGDPPGTEAAELLVSLHDHIEGWPLDDLALENLCCAFACTYRRGRRCLHHVLDHRTPANFHSWRKRTKDIWYQARLLQKLNPTVLCEIADAADTLGGHLGDLHDLFFLRARLPDCPAPASEKKILEGLICARESVLESNALDLGRRFFAEKPGPFRGRLLRYAQS